MSISLPAQLPSREQRRAAVAERLLDALERLVQRHRALALHTEHTELHAELITAEVAHQLATARNDLLRHPPRSGRVE
jgi:hypothetical protein